MVYELARGVTLLDDVRRASRASFREVFATLAEARWAGRPIVLIFGDIVDPEETSGDPCAELAGWIAASGARHVRLHGDGMSSVASALRSFPTFRGTLRHVAQGDDPAAIFDESLSAIEGAVILVKGSLGTCLQPLAQHIRESLASPNPVPAPPEWHSQFRSVGITGTNGKSTITTFLDGIARCSGHSTVRATTLGYFLNGEPAEFSESYDGFLRVLDVGRQRGATLAVLEMTSEALRRGFAKSWPCQVAIFSNLTHDHQDVHGTPEHYLASKAQLFLALPGKGGTAVLNASDPACELIENILPKETRVLRFGSTSRGTPYAACDLFVTDVRATWEGSEVSWTSTNKALLGLPNPFHVPAQGSVFGENAAAALLGALAIGVGPEEAGRALGQLSPPAGRFERVATGPDVVIDYAHSPDALIRVVGTAKTLAERQGGRVLLVFGAGGERDTRKRAPMGKAACDANEVFVTSDNPRREDPRAIANDILQGLVGHDAVHLELDRAKAIEMAIGSAAPEDVVLICGKGHERIQVFRQTTVPFSDVDVARACVARRASISK
jgi:UDP-N-acetylmuramoyl-L-alanyl-D-glutamate--2,6-diaminopimelate ligase